MARLGVRMMIRAVPVALVDFLAVVLCSHVNSVDGCVHRRTITLQDGDAVRAGLQHDPVHCS